MADRLPIYELESEIVTRLSPGGRLVLSAPTGSGKSTQVPQMLLRHDVLNAADGRPGQVIILQPRRLAARLLAARVAAELNVKLGREVGYSIRFENVSSAATRIRYVTEGVLLRQMLEDPDLKGVTALIFDEFHERHLYGDITLARALDLQETRRPDLRLAVMSATLDSARLAEYLRTRADGGPAELAVLRSEGRCFPVEIRHREAALTGPRGRTAPVWEQAAEAFADYVREGGAGDVLVFMPGAYEIQRTIEAIRQRPASDGFVVLPLHGELPPREQDAAVSRQSRRKVVVATNVAETSLTIDGVRLVIDSGLARIPRFDPYRGINTLLVEKISQASADQRAGRAGRTAPGVCCRLWSEAEHRERPVQEKPEVQRLDLAEVVLTLKAAGVADLEQFRWLEHPGTRRLAHAEELLLDLGALARPRAAAGGNADAGTDAEAPSSASAVTPLGRRMLKFPLHPRYARMLLAAEELGCVYQACLAAALTQGRDLLQRNVDKRAREFREDLLGHQAESDFFPLMRAWNYAAKNDFRVPACRRLGVNATAARQVGPLFQQFLRIAEREGLDTQPRRGDDTRLQKCLLIGFSDRLAHRLDSGTRRCELVHHRVGFLAKESLVQHSDLFVAAEVREIGQLGGDLKTVLSLATAVDAGWLEELFPDDLDRELEVFYDAHAKRVYAEELRTFRGLELEARQLEPPPLEAAAKILAERIAAGKIELKHWNHGVEQWIQRLNRLAAWCPEFELPPITDEARLTLLEQICQGAFTYKEIKERPVKPVVMDWLSPAQRELLDKHAPERVKLSNGRRPKVTYSANEAPFIALRIQELYDVRETPRIALGRTPLLVHILGPNMRPVQITQDLAGFWREHYPRVKSELQRRYPKHQWR